MTYEMIAQKIDKAFEQVKNVTLATANKSGVVSARSMVLVNDGLKVYMQTDSKFDKIKDINENPNVAISFAGYSFKGKAKTIGHARKNEMFIAKLKEKHLKTYKSYTELPDTVLIEIELTSVRIWGFESDDIHDDVIICDVDFLNKRISQVIYNKL